MTGATTPEARASGSLRGAARGTDRDVWPRDFGRDGVSGLVSLERAMRARDVSRPDADDEAEARDVLETLLARIDGRRPAGARR